MSNSVLTVSQVSNVYYDSSTRAAEKIKDAMLIFQDCSNKGTCASDIPDFNFCSPQPDATEFRNLYHLTLFNYRYATQYNLPFAAIYPQVYPLQVLINNTLAANSTGAVLRVTHQMMNNASIQSPTCTKWSNKTNLDREVEFSGPAMEFIKCKFFSSDMDFVPEGNLFPAQNGSGCLYPEAESKEFQNTNDWWVRHLGLTDKDLDETERLLIVHGSYDGTSATANPKLTLSSYRNQSRVIIVDGTAHTEDSYPTRIIPQGLKPQLDLVSSAEFVEETLLTFVDSRNKEAVYYGMD